MKVTKQAESDRNSQNNCTLTSTNHDLHHDPSLDYGYQAISYEPMQKPRQTHELMYMWRIPEATKDLGRFFFLHILHGLYKNFRSQPIVVKTIQLFQG